MNNNDKKKKKLQVQKELVELGTSVERDLTYIDELSMLIRYKKYLGYITKKLQKYILPTDTTYDCIKQEILTKCCTLYIKIEDYEKRKN